MNMETTETVSDERLEYLKGLAGMNDGDWDPLLPPDVDDDWESICAELQRRRQAEREAREGLGQRRRRAGKLGA